MWNWGFMEVRGGERKESGYPQAAWLLSQEWVLLSGSLATCHRVPAGMWGVGCGCAVLGKAVPPDDSFLQSAGSEAAFFASSRIQQAEGRGGGVGGGGKKSHSAAFSAPLFLFRCQQASSF